MSNNQNDEDLPRTAHPVPRHHRHVYPYTSRSGTQSAPVMPVAVQQTANDVANLRELLREAYFELVDKRDNANAQASEENMETFKAGLKAYKEAQENFRKELLKLPKEDRVWVMKNQRELYDNIARVRNQRANYMDYNEFRKEWKEDNPKATQKQIGIEWRKYKEEHQLPSKPGQCAKLPVGMCMENPNCSYAVGLKREGCRKAKSVRKSRKVRRSPKKSPRGRKCSRGMKKGSKACKRKPGPKRSRKVRRSPKKSPRGRKSAKRCSRGMRKGSKVCRRKPGPKRSSKRVCKRGVGKGSKACRRKPGPKRSTTRKSR